MILNQRNIAFNNNLLINLTFGFFPISFIFGNFITNINILLFCCFGIFYLRSKILTTEFPISIKIIFLFFFVILFSTGLSFIKSLYFQEYEYVDLVRLIKSVLFFRYFLMIIVAYLLIKFNILNFEFFLIFATLASLLISLDIIYQYNFGFNIIGLPSTEPSLGDWGHKGFGFHNSSFFGEELIAGGFLKNFSFFAIFFIAFSLKNKKIFKFIMTALVICILGIGIMLSGNRMPFILFILGLFLIFLFNSNLKKTILIGFLFLSIVFGFIISFDDHIKIKYESVYGNMKYSLSNIFSTEYNPYSDREEPESSSENLWIDEIKNEWEIFHNPPKWDEGEPVIDDFEFFWVLQNTKNSNTKLYLTALDVWGKNKIFGNGIKSFREDCKKFAIHKKDRLCSNHPHNYYLEILTDTGIFGILVTLVIGLSFIVFIFKNFKFLNEKSLENLILLSATISIIIEVFPIRTTGSLFTTSNATYLVLIGSIILSHDKLLKVKNFR